MAEALFQFVDFYRNLASESLTSGLSKAVAIIRILESGLNINEKLDLMFVVQASRIASDNISVEDVRPSDIELRGIFWANAVMPNLQIPAGTQGN